MLKSKLYILSPITKLSQPDFFTIAPIIGYQLAKKHFIIFSGNEANYIASKKFGFEDSENYIKIIVSKGKKIIHRPRKNLGFKTPYELFFKNKNLLTDALHS